MSDIADIFVGYKREDLDRILPLVKALEREGYSVWFDRKLVPGDNWEQRILQQAQRARCVAIAWSNLSVTEHGTYASDRLNGEADLGYERNVLLPILLDRNRIPLHHSRLQFADLSNWSGETDSDDFQGLIKGIHSYINGERQPPSDTELWALQLARETNTADALNDFIVNHRHSRLVDVAKSHLRELEFAAEAPVFFIEDDDELKRFYPGERLLGYPFSDSERVTGYVAIERLSGERAAKTVVRIEHEPFELSNMVKAHTETAYQDLMRFLDSQSIHEARNARCAGLKTTGGLFSGAPRLTVQETGYESYLRSNLVIDHSLPNRRSLRQILHSDGKLDRFEESELSNTIGINVLLVNPAGDVPIQIRSTGVAFRAGQLCSSASGTFEIADIPRSGARLVQCNLLREIEEELGTKILAKCGAPTIVGLARELARGGQLEIFVVVEADFTQDDINTSFVRARDSHESKRVEYLRFDRDGSKYNKRQIESAIDDLERRYPNSCSAPLRAHLSL